MSLTKHYKHIKKAVRRSRFVDSFFLNLYSSCPYHACQHGCVYCDGRAEKYYVEGDFERDIGIRPNIVQCLRNELPKCKERGFLAFGSGVSDPYQPVEAEEILMPGCAHVASDNHFPVSVMTKSALVQRDLSLWKKVAKSAGFVLFVSLHTLDSAIARIFEPAADSVEKRMETLKQFKNAGLHVGVLAMPFLPFISDSPEDITSFYQAMKKLNIDFVTPGLLTLRPGRQKEKYMETIHAHFPDLTKEYDKLYGKNLPSGSPDAVYSRNFYHQTSTIARKTGISTKPGHYIYSGKVPLYDEFYILLNHMMTIYYAEGVDISPLEKAFSRYHRWLDSEKRFLYRKRSLDEHHLESKMALALESGEFESILRNSKLYHFLLNIYNEKNSYFDYLTLKLRQK